MTTIGVLGGGQLGRMLALAGLRLGQRFCFLDPAPDAPAADLGRHVVASYTDESALDEIASIADVVTFEFENVPGPSARRLAARVPVFPPPQALEAAQRRSEEKAWFEKLGIPTSPYAVVENERELAAAVNQTGNPVVVKTSSGGYDGKGQAVVSNRDELEGLWVQLGADELVVEEYVDFNRELSIIAVRNRAGDSAFYPLVENHHSGGILRTSLAPAPGLTRVLQSEAQEIATALLEAFDYVGILTVELFETPNGLLANEMAPRVHNSGHYSIEGAACSQFENHVRAICDLPLGSTEATGNAIMFNLISEVPDRSALLSVPRTQVHLYGKEPRPGRKLGHVTLVDAADEDVECVRALID